MKNIPVSVEWKNNKLYLLDQRKLPEDENIVVCEDLKEVIVSIKTLTVRGAPAIGIAAAYGILLGLEHAGLEEINRVFDSRASELVNARPTAVNLAWALNRMLSCQKANRTNPNIYQCLLREAKFIHQSDRESCRAIGENGLELVRKHPNILTHCNAGSLAVSELGTALAPIYIANEQGNNVHVFVNETRPLLQGARLTAFELSRNGVPCTLISDNMAAHIMSEGKIDIVITGADRIAANGDAANKIGTLSIAIAAKYFRIPFYIAVPLSTIDCSTISGSDILIEERDGNEVTHFRGTRIAPPEVSARSPAFDVTPAELIAGIVTEKGILRPPFTEAITDLMV